MRVQSYFLYKRKEYHFPEKEGNIKSFACYDGFVKKVDDDEGFYDDTADRGNNTIICVLCKNNVMN